jgi:two-component system response regulator YesN
LRIFIIDDEQASREAAQILISNQSIPGCEIQESANGQAALELIRNGYQPDIILCDMKMPLLDGIGLIQALREENVDCPIIVISGYDDFQYMRAAIQGKAVDYLRKPFIRKQFYEALSKAVAERESQQRLRQYSKGWSRNQLAIAANLWQEYSMAGLLRGDHGINDEIKTILSEMGVAPQSKVALAVVVPKNQERIILERYRGDRSLFHFAVRNIFEEVFGRHSYLCRLEKQVWVAVSSVHDQAVVPEFAVKLTLCQEHWSKYLHFDIISDGTASVCNWVGISDGVHERIRQLSAYNLVNTYRRNQLAPPAKRIEFREGDFKELLWLLQKAAEGGNLEHATRIASQFVDKLGAMPKVTLLDLQLITNQVNAILSGFVHAHAEYSIAHTSEDLLPNLIGDFQEWEYALVERVARLHRRMGASKPVNTMENVREYIERHFDQSITLSGLAKRFHMSVQHLSRRYKESFHVPPLAMVIGLRVNKAKSLLVHTAMPIVQIANAVGYEDENYFGKAFKKATKMSPSQYRDTYTTLYACQKTEQLR